MNDRNISARHRIQQSIQEGRYSPEIMLGMSGYKARERSGVGHWRLLDVIPDYAEPWKILSWQDIVDELCKYNDMHLQGVTNQQSNLNM